MRRVIIWGTGSDYDKYIPLIELEAMKGNLEIVGVTSKEEHLRCVSRYRFIPVQRMEEENFDNIIITSAKFFQEICGEAACHGIMRERIIHPEVFAIPYFDFGRYIKVAEKSPSIVSSHCWGGLVYHLLKIPFNSPFINTLFDDEDYLRLLERLPYYISLPLKEGEIDRTRAVTGYLGDVKIQFIHHSSFIQAKADWEKRIGRLDLDNLFVEMTIGSGKEEIARKFATMNYDRKIAFCATPYEHKDIMYMKEWEVNQLAVKFSYMFGIYVLDMVKPVRKIACPIDILKLLAGEGDFVMRHMG